MKLEKKNSNENDNVDYVLINGHKIYKIKLIKIHLNIFTHIPFKKNGRGGKY